MLWLVRLPRQLTLPAPLLTQVAHGDYATQVAMVVLSYIVYWLLTDHVLGFVGRVAGSNDAELVLGGEPTIGIVGGGARGHAHAAADGTRAPLARLQPTAH